MIMRVIKHVFCILWTFLQLWTFLGCSDFQSISLNHIDATIELLPQNINLNERDILNLNLDKDGFVFLEGNFYIVSKAENEIQTFGGSCKSSVFKPTRCQNFTLYSFFTNWPKYYPIVGECCLGHYLMQGRQEIFCSGGNRKIEFQNGRSGLSMGCFSVPYVGQLNSKNTATVGVDVPLMLNEVVYLGNEVNGWFGKEYVIRDCEENIFFQIQMSNLLDIESVALMESLTYGKLCWFILRRLRSSNQWLVAYNIKSDIVFCKKLDTDGCVSYYFVDDSAISKNPFLVKVMNEHLECTEDECLRKCYVKSYLTIDEM